MSGQIKEQFALDHARDFRARFPRSGIAPELETDTPAFVVVYDGLTTIMGMSVAPPGQDENGKAAALSTAPPTQYSGVLCVVLDGAPIVYVNVDTGT